MTIRLGLELLQVTSAQLDQTRPSVMMMFEPMATGSRKGAPDRIRTSAASCVLLLA